MKKRLLSIVSTVLATSIFMSNISNQIILHAEGFEEIEEIESSDISSECVEKDEQEAVDSSASEEVTSGNASENYFSEEDNDEDIINSENEEITVSNVLNASSWQSWYYADNDEHIDWQYSEGILYFNMMYASRAGVIDLCYSNPSYKQLDVPWKSFLNEVNEVQYSYVNEDTLIIEDALSGSKIHQFILDAYDRLSDFAFLGDRAFSNCQQLEKVSLEADAISIGDDCFHNCSNLNNISFVNCINGLSAGKGAFFGCTSLESIDLTSMKEQDLICTGTFGECTSLRSIYLPGTIVFIDDSAFSGCTSLKDVYFDGTMDAWKNIEIYDAGNEAIENATIHCSDGIYGNGAKTLRALVINGMRDDIESENSGNNDATMMATLFRENQLDDYIINESNIIQFSYNCDKDLISNAKIDNVIESTFLGTADDDLSIFYYTGHSVSNYGICTSVDRIENGEKVYNAYSGTALLNKLANTINGQIVVIIDSCFSGKFISEGLKTLNEEDKKRISILVSCDDNQYSGLKTHISWRYGKSRYSVFSYYLGDGLGYFNAQLKADSNGDKAITFDELFSYVKRKVSAQTFIRKHHMSVKSYSVNNTMPIFKYDFTINKYEKYGTIKMPFYSDYRPTDSSKINIDVNWDFEYFLNDARYFNTQLGLATVSLANMAYHPSEMKNALERLGFGDHYHQNGDENNEFLHPVTYFDYTKAIIDGKLYNIFVIVARGTSGGADFATDIVDGANFFNQASENTKNDLVSYMKTETGENEEELKADNNIFLMTGHSLGAATVNNLSYRLTEYALPSSIYCYTYESPHTCFAYQTLNTQVMPHNIINTLDFVPNLPSTPLSTTFGHNYFFTSSLLDYNLVYQVCGTKNIDAVLFWHKGVIRYHSMDFNLVLLLELTANERKLSPTEYAKNVVEIACPVDVEIYSDGTLIANTVNDSVNNLYPEIAQIVKVGDKKYIFIIDNKRIQIKITGYDNGKMNFSIRRDDYLNTSANTYKEYKNVSISPQKTFLSTVDFSNLTDRTAKDIKLYVIDISNGGNLDDENIRKAEVGVYGTETEIVSNSTDSDSSQQDSKQETVDSNKATFTVSKSELSVKKLKKKKQKVTIKIGNSKGKITAKNKTSKKLKKYLSLKVKGRNVICTFKKGAKKGTYKVKVKVAKKGKYKKTTKTISIKVK